MSDDEKTYDGAEILGRISGQGRETVLKIWKDVKLNHKRLNECVGPHDFQCDMPNEPTSPQARWVCSLCNGWVGGVNKKWYELGLKHGAGK